MTAASKPETVALPDKPSELLTVALDDLEKVEQMPGYIVDMAHFHWPDVNGCRVCLAGAVIVNRLGGDPGQHLGPIKFDDRTAEAMYALDSLRCGFVGDAFSNLRLSVRDGAKFDRDVLDYSDDPAAFKAELRQLAADLKAGGF